MARLICLLKKKKKKKKKKIKISPAAAVIGALRIVTSSLSKRQVQCSECVIYIHELLQYIVQLFNNKPKHLHAVTRESNSLRGNSGNLGRDGKH